MNWTLKENPAGIAKLAFNPKVGSHLLATAKRIAVDARRLTDSERVANGIEAEGPDLGRFGMVAHVVASHWTSAFVEFGTVRQPPTAMLRRAGEQSGRFTGVRQ